MSSPAIQLHLNVSVHRLAKQEEKKKINQILFFFHISRFVSFRMIIKFMHYLTLPRQVFFYYIAIFVYLNKCSICYKSFCLTATKRKKKKQKRALICLWICTAKRILFISIKNWIFVFLIRQYNLLELMMFVVNGGIVSLCQ